MIKGVDSHPLGATDAGADRDSHDRDLLCQVVARCTLRVKHIGSCSTRPPREIAPVDFGPEASKRRRY